MKRSPSQLLTLCAPLLCIGAPVFAQQGDGTEVALRVAVVKPAKIPTSSGSLSQIKAPDGFTVSTFATGLKNSRILAIGDNGNVYVSRRDQGDVLLLKDANGDGRADGAPIAVAHRAGAHGIAVHKQKLYLVTVKELFVADIQGDGTLGPLTMLLGDLPDSGQHPNRTIAIGPDEMLYISVGSTCNACNESNPENATLLRVSLDGRSRTIFASGLRNTIGFDWHPQTGELWGMDHGIDYLGDDAQPEELNKIEKGKQYGWPHVWGEGGLNPQSSPPGEISKEEWKKNSVPMTLGYTAHSAPMQMAFYTAAAFPADYRGDAFVAMRGSWNRTTPSGYEIVRIDFDGATPRKIEPFVQGFLGVDKKTHIARPVGLAVAADGSLLMADDANGTIYRVAYGNSVKSSPSAMGKAPATAMKQQTMQGTGVALAKQRDETNTAKAIAIDSGSFSPNAAIPLKHSEYADGVSPALSWKRVEGAKSYAIIMEDPDAKPITPFVHWLAWNIPSTVTSLPEGLQEQPRLTEPEGLLQGKTSRGSVGYFGPRPPAGDPPHHYHFQVFALDTQLNVPAGADRDTLLAAMKGHVIASGEIVGVFQQTTRPLK